MRSNELFGRRVRQRHLPGAAQVIKKVAHFLVFKLVEQSFRHHGQLALVQLADVLARNEERFVCSDDCNRVGTLLFHNARDISVVSRFDVPGAILVWNDGVWIDDVLEDVTKIATIRAGQIGADFAAFVEQGVALLAGAIEQCATTRGVTRLRAARVVNAHVMINDHFSVGGGFADGAPNFVEFGDQLRGFSNCEVNE